MPYPHVYDLFIRYTGIIEKSLNDTVLKTEIFHALVNRRFLVDGFLPRVKLECERPLAKSPTEPLNKCRL